uniref:NADH-ubiquinone oxidoreductase chain 4L n=1 Tax=Gryllodes sigillatus TaxID=13551 RepID=A0A7U0M7U7_9ORTH|nr:NADH dehydrogenase subunit 4L [Gryllodes sigillatus]QQX28021.1 NADH dehydrogenase subunit 4L [Gryllodes sigillatus]QWQ55686.1 NADH dehydrogenase subunit 4L [Gryllodes sigillatus]UBU97877.1 NADH dehydrogenase subunit 4L [Gryllodes sp.]
MFTFFCLVMMVFCYLSGIWVYCSKRKHLLVVLLSLEYMVLFTFFLLIYWLGMFDYELFLSMIYLVFAVCEGSLGLGILVSMVRSHGNDYFQSFVVLRC